MAERKYSPGLSVQIDGDTAILRLGQKESWDGAHLSLLRDSIRRAHEFDGYWSIAIDLTAVQYLPSGFFGQLLDWHDHGIALRILTPHERIRNMLWFQTYFQPQAGPLSGPRLSDQTFVMSAGSDAERPSVSLRRRGRPRSQAGTPPPDAALARKKATA